MISNAIGEENAAEGAEKEESGRADYAVSEQFERQRLKAVDAVTHCSQIGRMRKLSVEQPVRLRDVDDFVGAETA